MTVERPRRPLPTRRARGFTLVEMVIAMSVTSVLFVALIAWVASLMRMSATSVDLAATSRDRAAITGLLADDLLAIRVCDSATLEPAWDHATGDSVGFHADVVDATGAPGHDGTTDLVVWRVVDGRLERGVAPGDGSCPDTPVPVFATVATAVTQVPDGDPYFTAVVDGVPAAPVPDCTDVAVQCRFDRLDLALVAAEGTDSALPAEVTVSLSVAAESQRV